MQDNTPYRFVSMVRAALTAQTLGDLVNALCEALVALGLASTDRVSGPIRQVLRMRILRVATGAGRRHETAAISRLLMMSRGSRQPLPETHVWTILLHQGTDALRNRYLAGLVAASGAAGESSIVAVSDMTGSPLPVYTLRGPSAADTSPRVVQVAWDVTASVARACAQTGVYCVGRLRVTRRDKPARRLLDCMVDTAISATGLPAIVVRAFSLTATETERVPEMVQPLGCRVGIPARVAISAAG